MTAMHPGDGVYRNQTIRLADLTVVNDVIQGVTFENCHLIGPAVIVLLGNTTMGGCSFDGNEEAVLWDLQDRTQIMGAVGLHDCTIVGCRMQRIGIAAGGPQLEAIKQGFSSAS